MSPGIRTIVFIVVGLVVGGGVNMILVEIGNALVPLPPGVTMSTADGMKASMALLQPQNFAFPFLAHALSTLVGAYIATRWSRTSSRTPAMVIATMFFLGGVGMVFMVPGAPLWFIVVDLVLAYFPMGLLGYKTGRPRAQVLA